MQYDSKLAPIGIATYSRINHLKQTVEALQKNTLAEQSELYIFSDAPKEGDEEIVKKVRDYIHTVDGFKKVHIVERTTNGRIANNRGGLQYLLDKYGKAIFMEDDNVTSIYFLKYLNDALNYYEDRKDIVSIGGYNLPVRYSDQYQCDYYLSIYFNGWGFATWKDRNLVEIMSQNNQYYEMMNDKKLYKKIKKTAPSIIPGLKLIQEGKMDAGDYKIVFHLIKNNFYTIRPIKSFVDNIGNDGSGVHCCVSDKYQNNDLNTKEFKFIKNISYNKYFDSIEHKFNLKNNRLFTRELPYRIYKKLKFILVKNIDKLKRLDHEL